MPSSWPCIVLSFLPGLYRTEAGHQEDVRHEVHEQEHVYREGRHQERSPGDGLAAASGSSFPGQSVVHVSGSGGHVHGRRPAAGGRSALSHTARPAL